MVGITELSLIGIEKPPTGMAGSVYKQGPGLLAGCQVNAMIDFTANEIKVSGADVTGHQRIIISAVAESGFLVAAA